MPKVVALEDVKSRADRQRGRLRTDFFYTPENPNAPMAYLHQGDPGRVTGVHWHANDQFQIVVEGSGTLGRHKIAPYAAQFVRAHTPYGPIVGNEESGVSYISLLTRHDPNANYLPESRDTLLQVPDRKPWQTIQNLDFAVPTEHMVRGTVEVQAIPEMKDDRGLQAWSWAMGPDARMVTPDPTASEGQYVLVLSGSLRHQERDYKAFTVVFVEPESGPFAVHAGSQGAKAVVVNFPRATD
jgi:hypothetical protein